MTKPPIEKHGTAYHSTNHHTRSIEESSCARSIVFAAGKLIGHSGKTTALFVHTLFDIYTVELTHVPFNSTTVEEQRGKTFVETPSHKSMFMSCYAISSPHLPSSPTRGENFSPL